MISRDEAAKIAANEAVSLGIGVEIGRVVAASEMMFVAPKVYGVDLSACWIAYVMPLDNFRIAPSLIIAVDRSTGEVVYSGSANDEG
jgi:hypothetical protein